MQRRRGAPGLIRIIRTFGFGCDVKLPLYSL